MCIKPKINWQVLGLAIFEKLAKLMSMHTQSEKRPMNWVLHHVTTV